MMASTSERLSARDVSRAERIGQLNDELRRNGVGGQIVITRGVQELAATNVAELLKAIASFDQFEPGNDPYGERDFGMFDFQGHELMWKIDYYSDADFRFGSADPSNPDLTHRVLTVMLAEEY